MKIDSTLAIGRLDQVGKLARRAEAVAAYQETLDMPADAQRGKAIFKRECSQCHRLEGVGIITARGVP